MKQPTAKGDKPRRLRCLACMLMLTLLASLSVAAQADVLTLPSALSSISEEAFAGLDALQYVIVPEGVTRIEALAFAGSSLSEISLPASLEYIAEDAFVDCPLIRIHAPLDSFAYNWGLDRGYIVAVTDAGENGPDPDDPNPDDPNPDDPNPDDPDPEVPEDPELAMAQKIEQVIATGEAVLGSTYRYGCAGPTYFDCSGFVRYCYASVGVTVPHNSSAIANLQDYTRVFSLSSLRRGDIIAFDFSHSTPTTADHVAIYMGNGRIIEASSGAGLVRIKDVGSNTYYKSHVLVAIRIFD